MDIAKWALLLIGLMAFAIWGCATPVYVCMATKDSEETPVLVCAPYKGEK